ncbi:hypothetical protein [Thalassotalea euphylliae]|uniref:hypothetical protein n=1 Tax=Thalassotalea euphylliae TaxID=1655234 RepID=UPI0011C0346F|nr:hypothetical protein [Thalassotalea euphylliae]
MKKTFTPPKTKQVYVKLPRVFKAAYDQDNECITIESPETLCIYNPNESYQTYRFVKYIETVIFEYGTRIHISFRNLKKITAAASLLIFARVTKCQLCLNQPSDLEITLPESKEVKKTLVESGFWNGIKPGGASKVRKLIHTNNGYISGSNHDSEHYGKVISATLINLVQNGVNFSVPSIRILTRGIQEAILNIDYHAYDKKSLANQFDQLGDSRWWQCCWLDSGNNQLVFIIYDDGVGIPHTLQAQYPELSSSQIIEEAMKVGITRTMNPERGKGSNDIIKATCTFPNSHLIVMSGNGYFKSDSEGVTTKELPFTLEGTLIQWVLDYSVEKIDDCL